MLRYSAAINDETTTRYRDVAGCALMRTANLMALPVYIFFGENGVKTGRNRA